jgi:hypothetical protein|tara:strand:- start:309 stop:905 length:597 start_codon:yes stop_codon:yes gene_type:complete
MALTSLTVSKCARVAGGLKRIVLIDKAQIGGFSFDGSTHAVDDIFEAGSSTVSIAVDQGVEFTFRRNEARFEYSSERNDNSVDTCTINVFSSVPAPDATQLQAIENLRDTCELVVVVQEFGANTPLRIFGVDKFEFGTMEYQGATHNSGSARTETNMLELNLQGEQEELPYILSALTQVSLTGGSQAGNDAIMDHLAA